MANVDQLCFTTNKLDRLISNNDTQRNYAIFHCSSPFLAERNILGSIIAMKNIKWQMQSIKIIQCQVEYVNPDTFMDFIHSRISENSKD